MPIPLARVLLLDGYDETRETSQRELQRTGYDVIAVDEEEQAVAALASPTSPLHFIVLDVPPAEAEEAAQAIRAAAPRPPPTVIAIVAPSDAHRIREAAHATGIDYVLLRPCPPPELAKHLTRLLRSMLPVSQRR